jgi:hypothetical protein
MRYDIIKDQYQQDYGEGEMRPGSIQDIRCKGSGQLKDGAFGNRKIIRCLDCKGSGWLKCPRCNGTGYLPQFKHVEDGICFLWHGSVISETIFSDRLKTIKSQKEKYCIDPLNGWT